LYLKLDARQAVQSKGGAGLAQAPKPTEKKDTSAQSSGDDDVDKAFGPNVANIFVQVDQEVKGIQQSL
jgi:hypothetical protein